MGLFSFSDSRSWAGLPITIAVTTAGAATAEATAATAKAHAVRAAQYFIAFLVWCFWLVWPLAALS
jgi:hypothetical protein